MGIGEAISRQRSVVSGQRSVVSDQWSAVSGQRSAVSRQRSAVKISMRDFRELKVWQKSHLLALHMYKATLDFPREEIYGLTSQIRRCYTSIPANIAEGCGRGSGLDMARFFQIAMGSASELEYHLLLARDLRYIEESAHEVLHADVTEVKKMLTAFIKTLKA